MTSEHVLVRETKCTLIQKVSWFLDIDTSYVLQYVIYVIKVYSQILGAEFLHGYHFCSFWSIFVIISLIWRKYRALHYLYLNEIKIPKWSWRKMKKKIFNFFPGVFEISKPALVGSIILRKLKYVPIYAYHNFVKEILRMKEVLV